jgi:hypothetical protein
MKTIIILLFVVFGLSTTNNQFCDGFTNGYIDGYCYDQPVGICLEPLVPLCPLPRLNRDTYKDGYNTGFVQGKAQYRKNNRFYDDNDD